MSTCSRLAIALVLIPAAAWSKSGAECGPMVNYKQIIACAESRSPDVVRASLSVKEKTALTDVAAQFQNPELSVVSLTGEVDSEKRNETDVSLAFPIELGGKRSARKAIAGAEASKSELELFRAKAEIRKAVFLKLIRLRQIEGELDLVDESLQTFTKLVKQYESRPTLSPEQEVTLTVFKIAKGEYSFKRMEFEEELSSLEAFFKVTIGLGLESVKKALPPRIEKWPTARADNPDIKNSPLVSLYEADIQVAKGELSKAQSESWPTMNLGPSAKFSRESGRDFQQWGVNLSLPLPLLNVNGAGRAAASISVQAAEQKRDLAVQKLESERASLYKSYRKSVVALEETPNGHTLETKHKKVEGLFLRGLVPSSLVIEAHRSLVDFEKTRNEREMRAVESYLDIQVIDGDVAGLDI